jgi:hypothetical protein
MVWHRRTAKTDKAHAERINDEKGGESRRA